MCWPQVRRDGERSGGAVRKQGGGAREDDQNRRDKIWSRKQLVKAEGRLAQEGPPAAVYVRNDGCVVIRTEDLGTRAELVAVAPSGQDTPRVDMLKRLGETASLVPSEPRH